MNILVGISQVPDTATKIAIAADGTSIDSKGVKFILNPYDEFAIEEGLRLREKNGGTVTVITVGTDAGKEILRTALAMGADKAVLVKGDKFDAFLVAENIASLAKELAVDLVLFGRQSIDFDSFQVPPMAAELLGWPSITMVSSLNIDGTTVQADRDIEGGKESVSTALPCVISAQKGLNDPRYPKLPDIMKAKSKPIEERAATAIAPRVTVLSMALPSAKGTGKIFGDSEQDISEVVRLLREEAKVL